MRGILIISVLFCLVATMSYGQTLQAWIDAAENSMEEKDFYSAMHYYEVALEIDSSQLDVAYNLATASRHFKSYAKARELYSWIQEKDTRAELPQTSFWLGYVQHIQGAYDSAIANYQIYLGEHADENTLMTSEANRLIGYCLWAIDELQAEIDSTPVILMDSAMNTNFSEVGGLKKEEILYFTRLGFERPARDKNKDVPPYMAYSKVLSVEKDSIPVPLDSTLNDSLLHTAHLAFNHDETRVYYTLCEYANKYDIRCDIYFRDIVDGQWGEPQKLPAPINVDSATTTQPNVAYDDRLGKEVLYFVSDRSGGIGQLDIWYTEISDSNTFSRPQNLREINTKYNDITPFFHEESNSLYFSSDGRPGFGGYDIFVGEQKREEGWEEPVNKGRYFNSSYHDVYFSLSVDESYGLLSSNKIESQYLDTVLNACCYDLYEVEQEPVEVDLIVETYNARTGAPLNNVILYIEQRNGETIRVAKTSGDSAHYSMPLHRNKLYTVSGEKFLFHEDARTFSTYDIRSSETIVQRLYLEPIDVVVQVRTFDKRRREPLQDVTITLMDSTRNVLDQRTERYSHKTNFTLVPGTHYRLRGFKKGYRRDSSSLDRNILFDRDTFFVDLFLELGNLEDFLPLEIYFNNDQPRRTTAAGGTDIRYLQTYDAYYGQKQAFIDEYTQGLRGLQRDSAEAEMIGFFDDSLKRGKEDFESFLNILDQYLGEGLAFKIFLKGYASPLASAEYNDALSDRRIKTIQNEFAAFRGGILQKYFDSGDLDVTEQPFGEGTAPPGVSDDARNLRLSIFSPGASIERRVEIIEIVKDNTEQQ